jgi:hypothetical protein
MVPKSIRGKRVLRIHPKNVLSSFYREIIIYPQRQLFKKNVAIWAKAKDVSWDIRPVVGTTKWFDMAGLCVRAGNCCESRAADLAAEVVQSLNPLAHRGAADHPSRR